MLSITRPSVWTGDDAVALRTFLETDTGKKFREALQSAVPTGGQLIHSSSSVTLGIIMGSTRMLDTIVALVLPSEPVAPEQSSLPDIDNDELFTPDGKLKTT